MIIQSIELKNFRNYERLCLSFDAGVNIFYGNNAQGKTNLLEAVYAGCTAKSHKAAKDRELIRFSEEEAHIKLNLLKKDVPYRIDMHIKKNRSKGIAVNGIPLRRASELFGIANVVFFSPEDLGIIKHGPSERRRFMDMELCQLSRIYTHNLISYNRIMNQKNRLLKEADWNPQFDDVLSVYNEQLLQYGTALIRERSRFIEQLNELTLEIHGSITKEKEQLLLTYEGNVSEEGFSEALLKARANERKQRMCLAGPHRDDIGFLINGVDIRHFGSQGQQRTAALSLKLSEISLVEMISGEKPILLLDDVLSELDRERQTLLLGRVGGIQTMMTCTGLDDFVKNRFHIDRLFHVTDGVITGEN